MMNRYHYRVQAERSGAWWAIHVPDLPGAFSQARHLSQVENMARDLIAFVLEVDTEDVSVSISRG
jgi:predicted RNase H-like HicB family nuclease